MLLFKILDPNLPRKLSYPSRPRRRLSLICKKKGGLRVESCGKIAPVNITNLACVRVRVCVRVCMRVRVRVCACAGVGARACVSISDQAVRCVTVGEPAEPP